MSSNEVQGAIAPRVIADVLIENSYISQLRKAV
jgi:hypothetical protein